MAIYHFSAQVISRGKGQSAVASASYRSGEKLVDERTGESKFYKRDVQPDSIILAPSHAPEWVHDRQRLWNEVEAVEKNWNSQLAREINVALPKELSMDQQKELIRDFAQEEFVKKGMVADISIHRDDENNPHAHIMLTMRAFNEDGTWANKKKRDYVFNENGEHVLDKNGNKKFITVPLTDWDRIETLEKWREEWANHTNLSLEKAGFQERISHLSHEARGLEEIPSVHLGYVAHAMEKRGEKSEIGNIQREIDGINKEIREQKIKLAEIDAEIKEVTGQIIKIKEKNSKSESRYSPEEQKVLDKATESLKGKDLTYSNIVNRLEQVERFQEQISTKEKEIYDKGFETKTNKDREDLEKYKNQRKRANTEQDILSKAKVILEKDFVQRLASKYPDNPEIKFMKFEQALKLHKLNKGMDRVIPISEIKQQYDNGKELLEKHEKSLKNNQTPLFDESKLERLNKSTELLGGIFEAVQQANKDIDKSNRKEEKPRYRGQKKKELEIER